MSAITGAIADVVTVIGEVFTALTGNALLVFFLAAGLLGVGIGMFKKLRSAAK